MAGLPSTVEPSGPITSAMTMRLEATPRFRQAVLLIALGLAMAEVALFALAWRLGALLEPEADPRAALASILLGSVLTAQAMAVVGLAWTLVAMSRTMLDFDADRLALEHPWRRWTGRWRSVRRAWLHRGWLALELEGQFRRWYVRVPAEDEPTVADLGAHLPPGAWLEGAALRRHVLRRLLPVVVGGAVLGGLALAALLGYLREALAG
jgi:hypothetical protein